MDWKMTAAGIAVGLLGGAAAWALARAGVAVLTRLPRKVPFAVELTAGSGERDRAQYRAAGRELGALLAGLLSALVVAAATALLREPDRLPAWPTWAWVAAWIMNGAVTVLAVYGIVRLVLLRRRLRFAWAARTAIGNVLKRLNFSGNRVFHDVAVEGAVIDHVVIGTRGIFAINVVPRAVAKGDGERPAAELKNGKLAFAGRAEALPVGDAARNMTLLAAAAGRIVGHRVPVRSVLAVPGWHTVPNDKGNHLVFNEGNLVTLTSWNTPDAYLMEEDCVALQAFLANACLRAAP
ncbi:MAG TPA: nuclease-related domain-containing protein [Gammaproteobacteria bacterium]